MIRVANIINNLQTGGAETTLLALLERVDRNRFEPIVISLIGEGTIGPRIRELGIEVISLGAARGRISARTLWSLSREIRTLRPQVAQAWMYHSNLATYLATRFMACRPAVAWNIRHSLQKLSQERFLTRQVIRAGAIAASRVDAIIANSTVCMSQHEAIGFNSPRNEVIHNGIDPTVIMPNPDAGHLLRNELGIGSDTVLIGSAARWHPMKGHRVLAEAVANLNSPQTHLVLMGRGCETGGAAEELRPQLGHRLHLLGERVPVSPTLAGLDCLVVPSWAEGFPNVLAEAMACGVPCITTDVGEAALLLDSPERVVPPGDSQAMAKAIRDLMSMPAKKRQTLGRSGRERIEGHFQINSMVSKYHSLWESLANHTCA